MTRLYADRGVENAEKEPEFTPLKTDIEVWRGEAPGAGFEAAYAMAAPIAGDELRLRERRDHASLNLIAAASQEAQTLFEMSQSLGVSLSLSETISVLASRLHRLIPFDSCALYLKTGDTLGLRYVDGGECKVVFDGSDLDG